jgi:Amt family ammonium transporter
VRALPAPEEVIMQINSGDTAWLLIATAMVVLMTPGLAFFYGGMVRQKNLLSTLMMSLVMLGLISILWAFYGYSVSFGPDFKGLFGTLQWAGLMNVGIEPSGTYAPTVPHFLFMMFQAAFAIITVALITGGVVERIRFSALLIFSAIWFTVVYCPVAHWIWGSGGWLAQLGAIDFAGGLVVHVNAGFAALAVALVLGPRTGFQEKEVMEPNSIPYVVLGTALLWFGWFGFNAGSALAANGQAAAAFVSTNFAGASAAFTWLILGWVHRRPSVLGVATGAVVGLAAVTPAAGYIHPMAAIPIGIAAATASYYVMLWRSRSSRIDESLDVFACHGVGGIIGVIAAGLLATAAIGGKSGLIDGNFGQAAVQLLAVAAIAGYSFGATWVIARVVDATLGLRVRTEEEMVGLDISQHGERAYGGFS